ncbi:serine racemase isoform X5 [Strigops habroptila]|uniref:serine racemase isoform X5 n=1 Tax=Strigops habroptila TaxID=2489341 RepID=UPI0011CFBC81|nr:serine racemase isoform X5 [Strigops habroptila]
MAEPHRLELRDVRAAERRVRERLHRTPLLTCTALDRLAGRRLLFKCELFQKTGSFKIRGALNAVRSLVEGSGRAGGELPRAVVTHSSGNHGQALACAAQAEGIPAYIVVPHTAPHCKQAAIRAYGATLVLCEPSDESRAETAARVVRETGGVMVHPNQEPAVIAGQGTIALEVLEQAPEVNAVVVPVGGGGMVAGIAVAIKALRPDVKVFAAEPCNADDCYQSKLRGELTPSLDPRETIADAVRTNIGPNTWPIIRDLVDDVLTVSEEEIKVKAPSSLLPAASIPSFSSHSSSSVPWISSQGSTTLTPPRMSNTHISSWEGLAEALLSQCPFRSPSLQLE